MRFVVRRVLPILAIAAVTVTAACEPVKKHPLKDTPPGQNIAYYFVVEGSQPDGENLTQSSSPFTNAPVCDPATTTALAGGPGSHVSYGPLLGQASQTLNSDGSVLLSVVFPGGPCQGASGFAVVAGLLGDLATSTVGTTLGSDPVASYLAFDVDGDGKFDPGGSGTGFGADVICRPAAVSPTAVAGSGTATIDDTSFECLSASPTSGPHTLAELKDGAISGITSSTPVAILAWLNSGTDRARATATEDDVNATVHSLTINGVEKL